MYKILIVDDREVFRRKLKRMPYWLDSHEKFQICYEASDGVEALELLRKEKIDLVLTDIRMPLIDGITLLKRIKEENLCPCVILLSEYAEFSYAKEGILNGAFDYIVKPIDNMKITDSFDRAYNYINTIQETTKIDVRFIDVLGEYILNGNDENALAYARYIDDECKTLSKKIENKIVWINDLLKKLQGAIFNKRPYLRKYIISKELFHVNLSEIPLDLKEDSIFLFLLKKILEHLKPFIIQTKNRMVQEICEMVLERPEEKHNLNRIAERYFVNQKYLGSVFKQEIKVSFSQYLSALKIHRAEVLLVDQNLKVYEVAEQLGYEDVDYFSRIFKNAVGKTPSNYRECWSQKQEAYRKK